jgi:hypothetical protein
VTGGSARGNYRPVSPRGNGRPDLNVVWMRGGYPSFTTYQTPVDAEALSHDAVNPAATSWAPRRLDVFTSEYYARGLLHSWFNGRWCGPEAQRFAGQQLAVLADANPRAAPLPVNPLVRELAED